MKITETFVDNEIVTQVFISNDEANSQECKEKIKSLKEDKANLVIFASGNKNVNECLQYVLQFMKNKPQKV